MPAKSDDYGTFCDWTDGWVILLLLNGYIERWTSKSSESCTWKELTVNEKKVSDFVEKMFPTIPICYGVVFMKRFNFEDNEDPEEETFFVVDDDRVIGHEGANRQAVDRRRRDDAELADARERHLQVAPGSASRSASACTSALSCFSRSFCATLPKFYSSSTTSRPRWAKLNRPEEQGMGADDDVVTDPSARRSLFTSKAIFAPVDRDAKSARSAAAIP